VRAVKNSVSDAAELWIAPNKQFCLQPSLECRQWWRRSDIGRQTVPHASRGHRKHKVSDCWQARHRHDECARLCWAKTPPGVEVCHTLEVVGKVRRSQAVMWNFKKLPKNFKSTFLKICSIFCILAHTLCVPSSVKIIQKLPKEE